MNKLWRADAVCHFSATATSTWDLRLHALGYRSSRCGFRPRSDGKVIRAYEASWSSHVGKGCESPLSVPFPALVRQLVSPHELDQSP